MHKVICDISGQTFRADEVRKNWRGQIVSLEDWEPRHPQEFLRGKLDRQTVRDPRPDVDNVSELVTASASVSSSGNTVSLVSADIGSVKRVASLSVTITDTGLTDYRSVLQVRTSTTTTDDLTEIDSPLLDALFAEAQSGEALVLPLSRSARHIEIRIQSSESRTVNATTSLAVTGGDSVTVSL